MPRSLPRTKPAVDEQPGDALRARHGQRPLRRGRLRQAGRTANGARRAGQGVMSFHEQSLLKIPSEVGFKQGREIDFEFA